MSHREFDPSLYLVTDRGLAGERRLSEIVDRALAGGATMVQVREKEVPTRAFLETVLQVRDVTARRGTALIVNDRVDVALAADADGVHVGQSDMPAREARGLLGPGRILGLTVTSAAEAREAERQGADYLGTDAVFATPTKPDAGTPLGLAGLRELVGATSLPVVAIGGIHAGNAREVLETGAAGLAVVSAVFAAADPGAAARELRAIVERSIHRSMPAGERRLPEGERR